MFSKTLLLLAANFFCTAVYSQEVTNLVFVGDSGITEDVKQAHSFIAVKEYPGNIFERLDYKLGGPLVLLRTYNDSTLTNLNGKYIEYTAEGNMRLAGDYADNLKQGPWHFYNDTGKITLTEMYENGILTSSQNPDTVKKENVDDNPGDREAVFKKGNSDWTKYLMAAMGKNDVSMNVQRSGKVQVLFTVDTTGKTTSIYLRKSAVFAYDEASIKIIRESPLWNPAIQNGNKVKAYRAQPLTFIYDEK